MFAEPLGGPMTPSSLEAGGPFGNDTVMPPEVVSPPLKGSGVFGVLGTLWQLPVGQSVGCGQEALLPEQLSVWSMEVQRSFAR
jgi:hypothetical protein